MFVEVWWFLVLPLLFGLGWFAARLDNRESASSKLPGAYFKGLNFLLNEQPDKAIDAFVDVVQLEPETIELHFALGNLFRRRGETERAIRVHKNLVERSDLTQDQREHALFELGQDYLKSGLLDRAEDAFNRLEGSQYRGAALNHRLQIAQMVRDWPQAIDLAEQLDRQAGESHHSVIAHFYCEQAETLAAKAADGDIEANNIAAAEALARAVEADPNHVRPLLIRGQLALANDDPEAAIKAWERAMKLKPQYASLIAQSWVDAYRSAGKVEQGIDALSAIHDEHPSVDVLTALYNATVDEKGEEPGTQYLKLALAKTPSLLGYEQLVNARARSADVEDSIRSEFELSQQLIKGQVGRLSRYVCGHCGFSARQYYWHCPGCTRWDSYTPRRAEELERS